MARFEIVASWKDNVDQTARTMSFVIVAKDAAEAEVRALALVEGNWGAPGKAAVETAKVDWGKKSPGKATTLDVKELVD